MIDEAAIRKRFKAMHGQLDERGLRLLAAAEARTAGYGGIAAVARATGMARSTIGRGLKDLDAPALAPETPGKWLEQGYEAMYALSWRDVQEVQLKALQLQFDKFSTSVAALEKLARREGVTRVESVEDALPLLFDHRVYKSYPLSLIEKRDFENGEWTVGRGAYETSQRGLFFKASYLHRF